MNSIKSIVCIVLCFLGTQMFSQNNLQSQKKQLSGTWVYVSGSGGFTGKGPGWPQGSVIVQYSKNGKFCKSENGKKIEKSKFKCVEKHTVSSGTQQQVIVYTKGLEQVFVVRNDSLFLNDNVVDGFEYVYIRKNK